MEGNTLQNAKKQILPQGGGYGAAMMQKGIKNCLEWEKNAQDPRQELKNYLDSSLEDTSDQIKWWGVSYSFI